jgi:RHS repeat-associated protein
MTMPLDSTGSFVGAMHVTTPIDGSWILTLNYSGDANYLPVTRTFQITTSTAPMILSCSPSTISSGGSTSCNAQVAGVTTGTISVYVDGTLQGNSGVDQSGTVVIAVPASSLPPGTRTVTASYFLADQTLSGTASQSITVTSGSTQSSGYSYSITDSNGNSGYAANGNVVAYTDSVNGQWSLGYDNLNRLASAATGANNYCWAYDSFGNRTAQGTQSTTCPSPGSTIPSNWSQLAVSSNNQFLGVSNPAGSVTSPYNYDGAGNMQAAPGDGGILSAVLYDGEGRICATRQPILAGLFSQTQYIYDAEGNRVAEGMIADWSKGCDLTQNGFQQTKAYIVGPHGEQMTELSVDTNGNSSWVHTNVYANSSLIATYSNDNGGSTPQTGAVHVFLSDWLGTKRVQTTYNGTTETTWANLPFGDGCNNCNGGGASEQHFTGKERDTESGLDYFGARYYSSNMGRWLSPDWADEPEAVPYSSLDNPQSLNLYGYVLNNPLSKTDPDGHCCWDGVVSFGRGVAKGIYNASGGGSQFDIAHTGNEYQNHDLPAANLTESAGMVVGTAITFLAPGGEEAEAVRGVNILENAAKGAAAEAKSATEIVQEGKTILGSHVGIQTDKGLRVADHLVQDGSKIINDETKAGGAVRTASQVAKDESMAANGGKIVGKNAPPELRGQTVKIETNVRKQP